ncbi:MAG: hypothetical protein A4E45_00810 [Methanosaeta sp. PtaB.Bin039]|nr:MAG: hypothetical protein A4E45_00810 [Methanosaeta sp. PtaB.Bin039]OPY44350.1 MAG: hypothetical protein A4E47_01583 [Methanosaeta sp. PtaU1.Bin028]HOT06214.1 DUF3006 domain-containing protein [Methanotrichaceae archaeon]HQF15476.1 DUF3006 domain-containing protein [Methanotrichaceae archaeon]HQI90211.1 DUF3006 domain-containing protein [Methanotrichaceae archaeon]
MRATVDRIEGGRAVLLVGRRRAGDVAGQPGEEMRIELPLALLPTETSEGDVLELILRKDEDATTAARRGASDLLDRLQQRGQRVGIVQGSTRQ